IRFLAVGVCDVAHAREHLRNAHALTLPKQIHLLTAVTAAPPLLYQYSDSGASWACGSKQSQKALEFLRDQASFRTCRSSRTAPTSGRRRSIRACRAKEQAEQR